MRNCSVDSVQQPEYGLSGATSIRVLFCDKREQERRIKGEPTGGNPWEEAEHLWLKCY